MSSAELRAPQRIHAERKEACRRNNPILATDNSAVMQGAAALKNSNQQVVSQRGLQGNAAFRVRTKRRLTFQNHQCADSLGSQPAERQDDVFKCLARL